ncbi:MAG TPA: hypothetical protein VFC07_00160, partial [Verrucomicrobiae bacterium]|nr:hypothetical protein [Verrucomicrobiae bacterium]
KEAGTYYMKTSNIEHRTPNIEWKMGKHLSPLLRRAERETEMCRRETSNIEHRMEDGGAPLPGPLPTPASCGEGDGNVQKGNIEHRTSNAEHRMEDGEAPLPDPMASQARHESVAQ